MLKVLLIGAGTMAKTHADAYQHMADVRVVGVVDIRNDEAEKLASGFDAKVYSTIEDALVHSQPDVVDVCVPTNLHYEFVLKAAKAKKHVICEKPLARNLEDAAQMIRVCEQAGVRLFVGHVVRFFPEYVKAKAAIEGGQIGRIGTVRTFRGGPFPMATNDWYADLESSGGVLLDLVIHDFDFLRSIFGEVERVYTLGLPEAERSKFDHAFISLRFHNGVIANVEGSWAEANSFHTEFEFAGDEGLLMHDSRSEAPIHLSLRAKDTNATGVSVPESPLNVSPYQLELEHFVDCMVTGKQAIVTAEDAYAAMRISMAAIESKMTGRPVTLKEETIE